MGLINSCNAPKDLIEQFAKDTAGAWWLKPDIKTRLLAIHHGNGKWAVLIKEDCGFEEEMLGGLVVPGSGHPSSSRWLVESEYTNDMAIAAAGYMAAVAKLSQ